MNKKSIRKNPRRGEARFSPLSFRKKRIRTLVVTGIVLGALFFSASILMHSYNGDSSLSASIYACNVEFHGEDFASIRRVELCRHGARLTSDLFERDRKKSGRSRLGLSRTEVLSSQAVIRCKNDFEYDSERFACQEGVSHYAKLYRIEERAPASLSAPQFEANERSRTPQRKPPVDDSEYL